MQGTAGPTAGGQQGGLHGAQPYYHPQHAAAPAHTQEQVQPDRPIGYGAFGVVWWVSQSKWDLFVVVYPFACLMPAYIADLDLSARPIRILDEFALLSP